MSDGGLRVLLDWRPAVSGRGGIATYAEALAGAYADAFPEDRLLLWAHRLRPGARRDADVPPPARLSAGRLPALLGTVLGRFGWGTDRLLGGADVVHWTDFVPLPATDAPIVATVHDVLFESLPACYTPGMRGRLRTTTTTIVRRAARVVVPSTQSRDDLVAHYDVRPEQVDVVPLAPRALPDAPPAREYGRYVLFVGTLEPRKNLARVLAAQRRLRAAGDDVRLVVAGPRGWLDGATVDAMARQPGVVWEGRVEPARLSALYGGALALAYPSLGEGYGLPVVEAMAAGLPVLVSRDTTTADVAGEAGIAVPARDTEAIAEGLARLLADPDLRARLGASGRRRAGALTWDAVARATRRTYRKAIRG